MRPVVAFAVGVVVGGALALLLLRAAPENSEGGPWRDRAEQAERELAAERRKTATLASQMRGLAERFDALAARLETLSTTAAEVFRAPGAAPTPNAARAARDEPAQEPAAPTPEFQPVPDEQWDALVSGALESEIERRLGTELPPERVQRLKDSLQRVRGASHSLTAEEPDANDPDAARRELERNIVLLQADRAFREELGVGVADFLRGLDPGQVEEVPR